MRNATSKRLFRLRMHRLCLAALVAVGASLGCRSVGPPGVLRDRASYSEALSQSWKDQILLNLVKIRYADAMVMVDVASIVTGHSLESRVNVSTKPYEFQESLSVGGEGKYTDRPTITYSPLRGTEFARTMLTPLRPESIFNLVEAGWPAGTLLRECVLSINGLRNRHASEAKKHPGDREFFVLLKALGRLQSAGAIAMRVKEAEDGGHIMVAVFPKEGATPEILADIEKAKQLLGLEPGLDEYNIVRRAIATGPDEIAVLTRSVLQVMIQLSSYVDVPPEHMADGRAAAGMPDDAAPAEGFAPLVHVQCGKRKPRDTYAAVPYMGHWFWVSNTDFVSKKTLSFLLLLLNMAEELEGQIAPVVTIPAR
jgi:hypothetical protein